MDNQNLVNINLGISGLLFLMVCWQFYKTYRLNRAGREFYHSGQGLDLEQILVDQNRNLNRLATDLKEIDQSLTALYKDNRNNYQKIGFIRFNPFDDAGGNISFALALLNAKDEGVVISSLHGREGTRVYAKTVKAGHSDFKLTEEELEAIQKAK